MNEYSFINAKEMARTKDESKLEAVKKTLIELIIKEGATNASIAKVAKKSKVSVGYLYRHYQSKEDLVIAIYTEIFNRLGEYLVLEINKGNDLESVVEGFYNQIVNEAKKDENRILFLLKMITDYSIEITDSMRNKLKDIINLLKDKFENEIAKNIEYEHIYLQVLGNILMFINVRKRGVLKNSSINSEDIKLLTKITIKSLK